MAALDRLEHAFKPGHRRPVDGVVEPVENVEVAIVPHARLSRQAGSCQKLTATAAKQI
jgi:hypothetical protein